MKRYLIAVVILILLMPEASWASEVFGKIVKITGSVQVSRPGVSEIITVDRTGFPVHQSDTILTGPDSRVMLQMKDDSRLILLSDSRLELENVQLVKVSLGRLLLDIVRKLTSGKRLRVETSRAIIGVKGTRFMVEADKDDANVYLKSGELSIESLEGDFWRFKRRQQDKFKAFNKDQQKELDSFIKTQEDEFKSFVGKGEKELKEYAKRFKLKSGQAVSLRGQQMAGIKFTPEVEGVFQLFEKW
ncbi:MAG: FecR domain-containing protein [Proteobacteria bacterium]|nr:FecR domain-containing protein [Pseudomonadota bacterium]